MRHRSALVVLLAIIVGTVPRLPAHNNAELVQGAAPGDIDLTFNAGTFQPPVPSASAVRAIGVQPDGKIVIGGVFTSINGTPRSLVARLDDDGSLDTTFVPVLRTLRGDSVSTIALQPDGKILVGGGFLLTDNSRRLCARLNSDGSLDSSFSVTTTGNHVFAIALQPDGKIIIAGHVGQVHGVSGYPYLARLNADGSLDTSLARDVVRINISAVAVQSDGKIVAGGSAGAGFNSLFRLNADGTADSSFDVGSGPNNNVYAIQIQPDGNVLIAGIFSSVNGIAHTCIARLNADGSDDSSFGPIVRDYINTMTLQPDGQILIGGDFTVNGVPRQNIGRLTASGELDAFAEGLTPSTAGGRIFSIALQADGKVLVGGEFEARVGTESRSRIVRLENNLEDAL